MDLNLFMVIVYEDVSINVTSPLNQSLGSGWEPLMKAFAAVRRQAICSRF
jgi:hypothetical protein